MILNSIYAFIATIGFAVLFNIRRKNIIYAAIGGGISWFIYLLMLNHQHSATFALFAATLVVSIYSESMARIIKTPVTTFIICSIIPLVPGAGMYNTMYATIRGDLNKSLSAGLETIISAGAIAVAIVLVSSTARLIFSRKKLLK
ncbi:MAG: threonine/serine exporter family protein [Bacillota bacterium]|nr:threonine/serine exporter family protein [Bacillota bacterium]